jgi:NAD(P)-dependent dehydrogenase (short-subunit alcohol dehydrogenase family)
VGLKTAVVPGGASGIGRAVAKRLRSDGFRVAVLDLSATDDGFGHVADVSDRAQVDTAIATIREEFGPILVLVNAAGVEGFKKFSRMSFQEWSKVIDVNLNAYSTPSTPCYPTCSRPDGDASSIFRRQARTPVSRSWPTTSRRSPG